HLLEQRGLCGVHLAQHLQPRDELATPPVLPTRHLSLLLSILGTKITSAAGPLPCRKEAIMTRHTSTSDTPTLRPGRTSASDGTPLGWLSVGTGPGLVVVHGA